jgi:UDP-N-acetylmuramate dehydrogenase
LALAQEIQDRVYDVTGVELEPEVRLVGAQGLINL